jgi:hypothetical protein
MRKSFVFGALIGVATLASVNSAFANTVNGSIWLVSAAVASDAIPGDVPGTPPNVTFTAPSDPLSFASGGAYTIGEFLASGGATNIVYNGASAGTSLLNTLFNFTGSVSVTTGETFTVQHDDGLTLVIGGVTVTPDEPGPTPPVVTLETYTGPTGNEPFQLVYGECCGAPAVLNVALPLSSVPEPATWSLMLLGVGGIGGLLRRKSRQIATAA